MILGVTYGWAEVSDDKTWHGFAFTKGYGLYLGTGVSTDDNYFEYQDMADIFSLAGPGYSDGIGLGIGILGVGYDVVGSERSLFGNKNDGFQLSFGFGVSTEQVIGGHIFNTITTIFALSTAEMDRFREGISEHGYTLSVNENGFLQVLDGDKVIETTDIPMKQINKYVWISEAANTEYNETTLYKGENIYEDR
ncbi:MAG: hypothetical protein D6732_26915 [Methanobacteriota archaeon]|nr:MAG: hypothetical protein D6732_26915 [Euryarchaeota archaeon]